MTFLFLYPAIGIGILGILDWGNFLLVGWIRIVLGIPPFSGGLFLFLWAAAVLGAGRMSGGDGTLVIRGPFRFTRNPQYLGCFLMLAGWSLLSAAPSAAAAALAAVLPLALVPFAEEPWLRKRYGSAFDDYCRRVPRFLRIPPGCTTG